MLRKSQPDFASWAQFLHCTRHGETTYGPLWRHTHQLPRFQPLNRDLDTDIVVVGAGVTGLTAAVQLSRAGRRVVVLERDEVAAGETGCTTGNLTDAIDARYRTITRDFGEDAAALVARSSREAID